MKKLTLLFVFIIFAYPYIKTLSQETTNNSGALTQVYTDLERVYSVQSGELSKKEEEERLSRLTPEVRAKMEEIKKLNKNKYNQLLRSSFPFGVMSNGNSEAVLAGLFNSSENQKKEKELEIDAELLALKYKVADSNSQQKMKNDLTNTLNQLFDIREAQKQDEVKRLQKRLQELQESLQARKQNKSEIVQRRIQELLGDSRYLRWE
ncbi:MAG: hypothetical protein D4R68_06085 [Ignavibacteriales bacterium]|nr:MAG: hypothetical protein D4R68_06085 [Ignavibacteriales bacterium]